MGKKSIFFVLLLFLMAGCVERGQNIQVIQKSTRMKYISSSVDNQASYTQPIYILECKPQKTRTDIIQNTISGTMLIAIGLMIFL